MAKAELSSEKVFERKVERARKLRAKIEAKYSEIKDMVSNKVETYKKKTKDQKN